MERVDALNRGEFVNNLIKIIKGLSSTKKTASVAMNGQWGCGKSFVLDMLEKELSVFHSYPEDVEKKYFVFRYNCWQYDYYEEPIMAIVSALQDTIGKYEELIDEKHKNYTERFFAISRIVLELCRQLTLGNLGVDVKKLYTAYEGVEEKQDFDTCLSLTMAVNDLKDCLREIAEVRPVLIVVDELDRCLPEYAIKVLERLHHIFYGVENIVVLMAYDDTQIEHTVEEIFGKGTDVNNYLRKFVDYKLYLENGSNTNNILKMFAYYFDRFNIDNDEEFCAFINQIFINKGMREREKYIEKAHLVDVIADVSLRNKYVCAAELLYVFLRDADFNDKEILWFMKFLTGDSWEVGPSPARKKIDDELIKILRDNFNNGRGSFGNPCIYFKNNLIGTAMYYISLINEKYLHDKGCGVIQQYRDYNKEERESIDKFAKNLLM